MYTLDAEDAVVELGDLPQMDVGAPRPVVVASEGLVCVEYYCAEDEPDWNSTNALDQISDKDVVACVLFERCLAQMLGPPNDEALASYPLAARGHG